MRKGPNPLEDISDAQIAETLISLIEKRKAAYSFWSESGSKIEQLKDEIQRRFIGRTIDED